MNYAVISLGGKQHVVTVGETLEVNRLETNENEVFDITDVLLVVDGETRAIGAPLVKGAKVTAKVVVHNKGEKIRVATFKAKSRQHKVRGHRQPLTTVEIVSITA